jgi:hypothetical protein
MAWNVMTVTTKGTELLASATVDNSLVLVGCVADKTVYATIDAAKAVSQVPSEYNAGTTDITILYVQNNNLFARAYFSTVDDPDDADVNSLYLYGRLYDSSDLFVIAVASSSRPTHLPVDGDPDNSYQVLFNLMYNVPNTAAVTASSASFCTVAEFNDLASRVVTTHIQGSETTGENQNIRGEKTFLNRLYTNGGFTSQSLSYVYSAFGVGYNNQSYQLSFQYVGGSPSTVAQKGFSRICTKDSNQDDGTAIMRIGTWTSGGGYNYYLDLVRETRWQDFPSGFYWDFGACGIFREGIKFSGAILPDAAATQQGYADVKVGIPSQPIAQVHAKEIHAKSRLFTDELSTEGSGDQIVLDGIGFNRTDSDEVFSGASTITNNGTLEINNNGSTLVFENSGVFNFNSNSGYKIGFNGGVEFNDATSFAKGIYVNGIFRNNDPQITNWDIGESSRPFNAIYVTGVYPTYVGSNLRPVTEIHAVKVGNSATPVPDVYANNLHGVINYPSRSTSSTITVEVGAIICVYGITKSAGETFTVTASSTKEGRLDGTAGDKYVPAGTYVALSTQGTGGSVGSILAMRIA